MKVSQQNGVAVSEFEIVTSDVCITVADGDANPDNKQQDPQSLPCSIKFSETV
jgi:hypothetical protein